MSSLHEECGVFGVWSPKHITVAQDVYYGLFALQHRGQESCGIVVNDDGVFRFHKDLGTVGDVFSEKELEDLGEGNMAIGHVRYGTTGGNEAQNAQPIVVNHIKGHLAIAHNGNLVNSYELRRELELSGSIFQMTTDTEVISHVIIRERLQCPSIEEAICRAMNHLEGAYSLTIMSPNKLIAVRDPQGFRPLCYGVREDGSYVVASESCALSACGAKFVRDIEPGEIVVFSEGEVRSITEHCGTKPRSACIFEWIYFARPDSVIDGTGVHESRMQAGAFLAKDHPADADIVIGVPDSGLDAALGFARESGIPYEIGFIKNKYIARTFIAPTQSLREKNVGIKLNPMPGVVKGKRVVLIDDSIVRGTTSAKIVKQLKEAGATEVHMRISAPPFMNPCYYGTDVDSQENLIACHHSIDEICDIIGADSLGYLSTERLGELIGCPQNEGYCDACFTARYQTKIPHDSGKSRFETKLSERKKS